MKTLIAYASKSGTSEKCAKMLAEKINGSELCNLLQEQTDPSTYDAVIIGGGVRMGTLPKQLKAYITKYSPILQTQKTGYYITCGFGDGYEKVFTQNIPVELLDASVVHSSFGGEMELSRLKGLDKFIAKAVANSLPEEKRVPVNLNMEAIAEFAKHF